MTISVLEIHTATSHTTVLGEDAILQTIITNYSSISWTVIKRFVIYGDAKRAGRRPIMLLETGSIVSLSGPGNEVATVQAPAQSFEERFAWDPSDVTAMFFSQHPDPVIP